MTQLAGALAHGELTVLGRLPDASNRAYLCEVPLAGHSSGGGVARCIYKPAAGERPLWDFPGATLAAREVLSAAVAGALGWDLVPVTVWRTDGPAGPGMCQEWVEATGPGPVGLYTDDEVPVGWWAIAEGRTSSGDVVVLAHEDSEDLMRLVVLDALVNNADRKGGHVLRRADGRLAGIDHGVTFHPEPKLRTVLWGWAGQPIPGWLLAEVESAQGRVRAVLGSAPDDGCAELGDPEVRAGEERLAALLGGRTFPVPGADWPALPWPPM